MPRPSRRRLVAVLVALSAAAASAQSTAGPRGVPLDSLARAFAEAHGLPSLVVGVVVDGERTVVGAGEVAGAVPGAHTLYEIGSVSKVLTGVVLADAVVRGETTLETPVRALLPDAAMAAQHESGPVRLWHLTTHTSGLPSVFMEMTFAPGFDQADPYAGFDVPMMLGGLGRTRVTAAPGEAFAYSNVGVGLLGYALGAQAGAPYAELVAERVLSPLGLTETVMSVPEDMADRFLMGHDAEGEPVAHWTFTGATEAAGGWRSTAADMLALGEAAVAPDATPLADALRLSMTPHFDLGGGQSVGLGWFLGPAPGAGHQMAWHNGGTGGFRSFFAVVPEAGVVVVALTNSDTSADAVGADVLRRVLALR